jgi:hypothetical protein
MNNPYFTNIKAWWEKQDKAKGLESGMSAGAANSAPKDQFSVDKYAGFKGSGQGLASGGVIGAIVGGATAQIGQFSNVNKAIKNLDTTVEGLQYDANGRPVYGGESINAAQENISALEKGEDSLKGGIDPATKAFAWAFGTKKKLRKAQSKLRKGVEKSQNNFNQASREFQSQQNQSEDYLQRMNNNRLYSLYQQQY